MHAVNQVGSVIEPFSGKNEINTFQTERLDKAATKIQSIFRGYRERSKTYLPKHVSPHLRNHFQKKDIGYVAISICREINEKLRATPSFHSNFVEANSKYYWIPFFDDNHQYMEVLDIKLSGSIILESLGKISHCFLIIQRIGQGVSKEVYESLSLRLEKRQVKVLDKVLIFPSNNNSATMNIRDETAILRQILKIFPQLESSIVSVPEVGSISDSNMVLDFSARPYWRQNRLNLDLEDALKQNSIPLFNYKSSTNVILNSLHYIKIISDIAKVLKTLHTKFYIHHDVKPANIFIRLTENMEISGVLGDFGNAGIVGSWRPSTHYYKYWDWSARYGIATPFTDLYGLTMILGQIFLPNFDEIFDHCQKGHSLNPKACKLYEEMSEYKKILNKTYKQECLVIFKDIGMSDLVDKIEKIPEDKLFDFLKTVQKHPLVGKNVYLDQCIFRYKINKRIFDLVFEAIRTSFNLFDYFSKNKSDYDAITDEFSNIQSETDVNTELTEVLRRLKKIFPFEQYLTEILSQINELSQEILENQ